MTDLRHELVAAGRRFDARGWVPATAGNLSVRDGDAFWVTASGRHKGRLSAEDFVRVDLQGRVLERSTPEAQPSAETSLHAAVYRTQPRAESVMHVHSFAGTYVGRFQHEGRLALPNVEILKAIGIRGQCPNVSIDVFANHADVPAIARDIESRFDARPPLVPAFLIQDHGLTAWGASPTEAEYSVEALELVFQLVSAERAGRMPHVRGG